MSGPIPSMPEHVILCPKCKHDSNKVNKTQRLVKIGQIRRYRICMRCGQHFVTYRPITIMPGTL